MKTKAAIIANFASRVIIAGANLAVLLLSARWLGPAARGDISLFVLDLSLIMLVSEMVGGPALVYQVPRINNLQLKSLGYGWGLISALLCLFVLYFFSLIPAHAGFFLVFSGMLLNAGAVHSQILVGRGRFWSFSFLSMISPLSILGFIIFSLHYDEKKVEIVYNGILIGAILSFIVGALLTPGTWSKKPVPWLKLIPEVFYNGGLNQSASIFHLLSNRFSYFLLQRQYGNAELGVYSLAVSVCESVLMFSHSLSMVFYSRSANRSDDEGLRRGTAAWAGWSFFITLCGCLVLCLMPGAWLVQLVGEGFKEASSYFFVLSLPVLFISYFQLITHYFSGQGNYRLNAGAGLIGAGVSIVFCFLLIPSIGMYGAALASVSGALAMFIFYVSRFLLHTSLSISDLVFFFRVKKSI
jgi:O-antigen/teichoic acid export membrane protein